MRNPKLFEGGSTEWHLETVSFAGIFGLKQAYYFKNTKEMQQWITIPNIITTKIIDSDHGKTIRNKTSTTNPALKNMREVNVLGQM